MKIKSGVGDGYSTKVDSNNRLHTFSVTEGVDRAQNVIGRTYSVYLSVTPSGANDYFFYLKNTGIAPIYLTDIRISSSVATSIYYKKVSGTPSYTSATDITPINRNFGSSRVLTATIKQDTDITGLVDDGTVFFEKIDVANKIYHLRTTSNIIITQGSSLAFQRSAATGAIEAAVSLVEGEISNVS